MKYQTEINNIKVLIEGNELQEAVKKMHSLQWDIGSIKIGDYLLGKICPNRILRAIMKDDNKLSISQKGDIKNIKDLKYDTYYNFKFLSETELYIDTLTQNYLNDIMTDLISMLPNEVSNYLNGLESKIVKFLNKNINTLKDQLSENYKKVNKNFEKKFRINFQDYNSWVYDTNNEKMIAIIK